ncbi:hypothetical protein P7K49_031466 [Saguinus oedipus]|uniref:Uncharacterized protein n=1 Tax=Saguinus oedipus TaxID=9490 RepID=A0ABQ9U0A8_SAGOE|nr:hypothetical protein P7K49_031466 [Saguinus oedipus]
MQSSAVRRNNYGRSDTDFFQHMSMDSSVAAPILENVSQTIVMLASESRMLDWSSSSLNQVVATGKPLIPNKASSSLTHSSSPIESSKHLSLSGTWSIVNPREETQQEGNLTDNTQASWGGSALMSRKHRKLLHGIHRADSVAWNPHKMLMAGIQCCALLVKDNSPPLQLSYDGYGSCDARKWGEDLEKDFTGEHSSRESPDLPSESGNSDQKKVEETILVPEDALYGFPSPVSLSGVHCMKVRMFSEAFLLLQNLQDLLPHLNPHPDTSYNYKQASELGREEDYPKRKMLSVNPGHQERTEPSSHGEFLEGMLGTDRLGDCISDWTRDMNRVRYALPYDAVKYSYPSISDKH